MGVIDSLRASSAWLNARPSLKSAILWAIPAILFGAVLRLLLTSYSPFAYYGSDSYSYFDFAHELLARGKWDLDPKRRYAYPIFAALVTVLPGAALSALAWVQHLFGLLTLIPLAYVVRKTLVAWRWLIIPVTMIYAGWPAIIWYEHELIGECLFYSMLVWAFAGWVAWMAKPANASRFWFFFVPFAVMMLTKPSGRFFWPGLLVALVCVAAWRYLRRPHWVALLALAVITPTVGKSTQGVRLMYTSAFPLTRLDTDLHAAYKAEIRPMVEQARRDLDHYYFAEIEYKRFLNFPENQDALPLWKELGSKKNDQKRSGIYKDLALEGIFSAPHLYLYIAAQRLVASSNPGEFKNVRFAADYMPERFRRLYQELVEDKPGVVRLLFGLSKKDPLPPYEKIAPLLKPVGTEENAERLRRYADWFSRNSVLAPKIGGLSQVSVREVRPSPLGWCLLAGIVLSLLPRYRNTVGLWVFISFAYLMGVFLVGSANPRFFAAVWSILLIALAIPADMLLGGVSGLLRMSFKKNTGASGESTQPTPIETIPVNR